MLSCAALVLATSVVLGQDHANAGEYLAFWNDYFQGEWTTTIIKGEDSGPGKTGTKGTWSCRLGPTGQCMIFASKSAGKPCDDALAGYDPKTKSWKEVFFLADGGHLIQLYRAPTGALSGDPAGKVIAGTAELISPDGRIETCKIQVKVVDRNTCEYSCIGRRVARERLPDLVWRFDRKMGH